MAGKVCTREDDARVLKWIKARCKGRSSDWIAKKFKTTDAAVRVATNKVRNADLVESGEHSSVVMPAYSFLERGARK